MSLLNQVLQDLEKRNAENVPEQQVKSNVSAVTSGWKNSYFLLISLVIIIVVLAFIAFGHQKQEITSSQSIQLKLPTPKQKVLSAKKPQKPTQTNQQKKPLVTQTGKTKNSSKAKQANHNSLKHSPEEKQPTQVTNSATKQTQTVELETKQNPVLSTPEPLIVKKPKQHKLSNQQKANQLFIHAKQQKNSHLRQLNLERALTLNSLHISTRLLLANTLLNNGLPYKAAEILDQGLQLLPQNLQFINQRSQLFLQKKQTQAALITLQRIDYRYVQDETYLSLIAAAFQQNNENFKSLKTYKRLIKTNPDKAEYWLGIAIAEEKQANSLLAIKAYQQALNKNTLKPAIVNYIKHRLSVLNTE